MGLREVIIIGVAIAMDALGVTISLGLNCKVRRNTKIKCILSFAIFQFLFILVGGIWGSFFDTYIASIPNLIGGIIMGIIGMVMILGGIKSEGDEKSILEKKYMHILLGISVSIDALVVGFTTFHYIGGYSLMFVDSVLAGLITLLICTIGFYLCRYVKKIDFICRYADFFGGIILVLFGLKMIFL
ncbi:manganese efflux pump MntP family protein [Clostridium gasigenes]|uniref:manganese efflux pump MntP n=1 Tax=Clostridium gasigenes TaxID=94869 RepID=UPI001C0CABED|nr:manganese efflux pump [Clostridium gasigenes]MBU3136037.1 manganese efflux pump MntP family protein [Clostridium gasigenes]